MYIGHLKRWHTSYACGFST